MSDDHLDLYHLAVGNRIPTCRRKIQKGGWIYHHLDEVEEDLDPLT